MTAGIGTCCVLLVYGCASFKVVKSEIVVMSEEQHVRSDMQRLLPLVCLPSDMSISRWLTTVEARELVKLCLRIWHQARQIVIDRIQAMMPGVRHLQRLRLPDAGERVFGNPMPGNELPTDVWRLIMAHLAETDHLQRSAGDAARDIAAAACTCRTANEAAGSGWQALQSAHVGWLLSDVPECSAVSEQQWYSDAQRFEQGMMTVGELHKVLNSCRKLYTHCWSLEAVQIHQDEYGMWRKRSVCELHWEVARLLTLRSRDCPQHAILVALTDRHGTISPVDAMSQYSLRRRDLKGLNKVGRGYSLSDVQFVACEKWNDMTSLQEQQRMASAARAKARPWEAAEQALKKEIWDRLFSEYMRKHEAGLLG